MKLNKINPRDMISKNTFSKSTWFVQSHDSTKTIGTLGVRTCITPSPLLTSECNTNKWNLRLVNIDPYDQGRKNESGTMFSVPVSYKTGVALNKRVNHSSSSPL